MKGGDKMKTDYELLSGVNNRDDILKVLNHEYAWKLSLPEDVAEKVAYHYGDGERGLIQALYNMYYI
jgi:hypothetical protein